MKNRSRDGTFLWRFAIGIVFLLTACLALWGSEEAAAHETWQVFINEVMTANKTAVADERGSYGDWVEIANLNDVPIDIGGWTLTDGESRAVGFTFPGMTLQPGEILLVWCDGKQKQTPGYPFHAPFRLSAQGETVLLRDANGEEVDRVEVPPLEKNESYARGPDGAWQRTALITPGQENTAQAHEGFFAASAAGTGALRISEVMSANVTYALAEGEICDYIEIHNAGSADVNLAGYGLSDDEKRPGRFVFENTVLPAGGYLLVRADGVLDAAALRAPFRVSSAGEQIVLTDPGDRLVDRMEIPEMDADRSCSRLADGTITTLYPPTPGASNDGDGLARTEAAMRSANPTGVLLNEAIASARAQNQRKSADDWVELYNTTGQTVDLSGWGLSDHPDRPRRWQFPSGASIAPGGYLTVYLNGEDKYKISEGKYAANFSLSFQRGETLTLSLPDGQVVDRLPVLGQKGGVSYGRLPGRDGYAYFEEPTRGAANDTPGKSGLARGVTFSRSGGWFTEGSVVLSLSAGAGETIRYTLDCSEPDETSPVYETPFEIRDTTIVRARSFAPDCVPSLTASQSFLFGQRHTLPVVSLVTDPDYLYDPKIGIYTMGERQLKYPFKGANFWNSWERAANVEYFTQEGAALFGQGVSLSLQGQYSRMRGQKAFKITARNAYGANRIDAAIFPHRDYTSYKSFILRASGQDSQYTRFRDMMLTGLTEGSGVLYQDGFPVVVYVNGEYFGHYNLRERIHKYSIAQWENWQDVDAISIVKSNKTVLHGSDKSYQNLLQWLKKHGVKTEEDLAYVDSIVDVDNYLTYVAIEMYIGNTDLLNVKRYCSPEGDGRWKWALFDTDWAFHTDTDSYRRWLDPVGAGSGRKTNNTLFVELMKYQPVRERFWGILGRVMYDYYRPSLVGERMKYYVEILEPEMPMQTAKWGGSVSNWNSKVKTVYTYATSRPKKFLSYVQKSTGMDRETMRRYFGDIMSEIGI